MVPGERRQGFFGKWSTRSGSSPPRGGSITGRYDRIVTFLSVDGMPFTCNQTLGYEQRTVYVVEGSYRGSRLEMKELSFTAAPSPLRLGASRPVQLCR